jgi:hypothetical protein
MNRSVKISVILAVTVLSAAGIFTVFSLNNNQSPTAVLGELDQPARQSIGDSWNPPKSKDCAVIITTIASVTIDKSVKDEEVIKSLIIKNTKLAAARLSKLAQETSDPVIAKWSYQSAIVLVNFPKAIIDKDLLAVAALYKEIGDLVANPPSSCDNTKDENA